LEFNEPRIGSLQKKEAARQCGVSMQMIREHTHMHLECVHTKIKRGKCSSREFERDRNIHREMKVTGRWKHERFNKGGAETS
jgi:hypothetical protein